MQYVAEYKLGVRGEAWKDTPVFVAVNVGAAQDSMQRSAEADGVVYQWCPDKVIAGAVAYGLSEAYECEVRWNWKGSLMGNYVGTGALPNTEESVEYSESDWWD